MNPLTTPLAIRWRRGLGLAKAGHVSPNGQSGRYDVLSSQEVVAYDVDLAAGTCTCPDHQRGVLSRGVEGAPWDRVMGQFVCKHIAAVVRALDYGLL